MRLRTIADANRRTGSRFQVRVRTGRGPHPFKLEREPVSSNGFKPEVRTRSSGSGSGSHHITSHHITSDQITSHHITSHHSTSHHQFNVRRFTEPRTEPPNRLRKKTAIQNVFSPRRFGGSTTNRLTPASVLAKNEPLCCKRFEPAIRVARTGGSRTCNSNRRFTTLQFEPAIQIRDSER